MSVINARLVDSKTTVAVDTPEIFYTAPARGKGTVITSFVVTNNSASIQNYKAYVVAASGTANTPIVPLRGVDPSDTDLPAEMAAQFLPAGFTLQMETGSIGGVSFSVSGREFS